MKRDNNYTDDNKKYIEYYRELKKRKNNLLKRTFNTSIITAMIMLSTLETKLIYDYYKDYLKKEKISTEEELIKYNEIKEENIVDINNDITLSDIKKYIYTSNFLDDKAKDYLYNEDLIKDVLPYINEYSYLKKIFINKFTNIRIIGYGREDNSYNTKYGYYIGKYPNTLFIRDYKEINDDNIDTLGHEYIHLLQTSGGLSGSSLYSLLDEASAEIISEEYFNECNKRSYSRQVKILKKLMEIVGVDPIIKYNFQDNFEVLEYYLSQYLNEKELEAFKNGLILSNNEFYLDQLDELINIMYQKKYNKDVKDDEIMNLIDNEDTLKRYYFNKKLINQENSYYLDPHNYDIERLNLEDAVNNDYLRIYGVNYEEITKEEAEKYDYVNVEVKRIYVDNFRETAVGSGNGFEEGTYISGYLDSNFISNEKEEDLISKGILKEVKYLVVNNKDKLSYKEYINNKNNYDNIEFSVNKGWVLNGDQIFREVHKKIYVEPFNDKKDGIKRTK